MSSDVATSVRVWDLPTRVFHWSLALSFFGAYLLAESERVRHLHVMFGYTVLALVLFRLVWGFLGTRYARFRSFAFGPHAVVDHLKGLARRDVREHAGHTPAGSWAIWLMLLLALITAVSGYLYFNEIGGEAMEEVHEVAANAWLLVVFVHVAGVIVSSVAERQNLARAMVTGYKRLGSAASNVRNASMIAVLMLAGISLFWGATTLSGRAPVLPSWAGTHALVESARLSSDHDSEDD
jgi:cytochrome b